MSLPSSSEISLLKSELLIVDDIEDIAVVERQGKSWETSELTRKKDRFIPRHCLLAVNGRLIDILCVKFSDFG